ncbi:MAG: YqiA/YcfP family alpha/beta fold hydrolase, partial [Paraglaciecola sp.]
MDYLVVYLHGFLSSPQSLKATQTLDFVKKH